MSEPENFKEKILQACLLLEAVDADRGLLIQVDPELRKRFLTAAGLVSRPDRDARRKLVRAGRKQNRADRKASDAELIEQTGIRELRAAPVFQTPAFLPPPPVNAQCEEFESTPEPAKQLSEERSCYICKRRYNTLHPFYDQLCPECGDFNYKKRFQTADLTGRTALVTGGRVKIGYQAAVMLLRAGAKVIVCTRFPRDAAARFAREKEFPEWQGRIEVHGLDLRHTPSVEAFCQHLCDTEPRLDFIINNACQTVRRPSGFYRHLMDAESEPWSQLPKQARALLESYETMRHAKGLLVEGPIALPKQWSPAQAPGLTHAAEMSQLAVLAEDLNFSKELFPEGLLDADLQQVDLRTMNSWRMELADVQSGELLEVQLVNAVAPFVLDSKLKPLMLKTPERDKHIVNVSAMEGQFYRRYKTARHPHTNMAKAALNMLTRTSAADYVRDGIHMNSVDTGWVTDEDPALLAARKVEEHGFSPPLDIVDGAARIVDPIFSGFNTGIHVWGQFLKDYKPVAW